VGRGVPRYSRAKGTSTGSRPTSARLLRGQHQLRPLPRPPAGQRTWKQDHSLRHEGLRSRARPRSAPLPFPFAKVRYEEAFMPLEVGPASSPLTSGWSWHLGRN